MATLPSSGELSMSTIESNYDNLNSSIGFELDNYYGKSRGLPTTGQIDIADFHGENPYQSLTTAVEDVGFGGFRYGFQSGISGEANFGSITGFGGFTNGTNTLGVLGFFWDNLDRVFLRVAESSGFAVLNEDATFKTARVGTSRSFSRTSAAYTNQSGYRQWLWSGITSNPFGSSGTRSVGFYIS